MATLSKAVKLNEVCYEIRGRVAEVANRIKEGGGHIDELHIGNPAQFGFNAPDEILQDVIRQLPDAQGYSHAQGLYAARKAVMQHCQLVGIPNVEVDDVFLGNGASELIMMAVLGMLNDGDELLLPTPDFPLWTAVTRLAGGTPVHYRCHEDAGWQPDPDELRALVSPRTRGIVVINPNNPTGALYDAETLRAIAALANECDLALLADEIYEKVVYDGRRHHPLASLSGDALCLTFSGLSKGYRLAGFRSGWLIVSGDRSGAVDYIEGLRILAASRLCPNVPAQCAVQTALGGHQSIADLTAADGRLARQRDLACDMLNAMPGVACERPKGAIYVFPRLDPAVHRIVDDEQLVLDLLLQERIHVVQGSAFNWTAPDHLRLTFLPHAEDLSGILERLARFLHRYRQ